AMNIDVDYLEYYYSRNRNFETLFNENQSSESELFLKANNTSEVQLRNYSARLDFDLPTSWATFNFGGRVNWIDNTSDVAFFFIENGNAVLDPLQTNLFEYKESTQALYASFQKKLSDKWQTQIGLRYETTQTDGVTTSVDPSLNQQNKFNYDQLFPTAYLMYQPSENHSFSANYSKRINRPIFWNLNPFRWYMSPFLILEGNPFLQPSFTDNFELNYNYGENWSFKAYTSITKNYQAQLPVFSLDGDQPVTELFWENFYDINQYGLTITHYFNKFDWWESINTLNAFYNDANFNRDINTDPVNGSQFSFNSSHSFVLTKKRNLFAEADFTYYSNGYRSFYTVTTGNQLDLGIRYSLRDKGWNFAIYGDDLFRSSLRFYEGQVANIPQRWGVYMDERMVRFVITYKFGNRKLSSTLRESGNEEEKGRLK
ncbi:MAG: outer membrane beta-barrel family protein, partial [Flavobacterium sp.]